MAENATPTNPTAGADAQTPVDSPVKACPASCPRCKAEITADQVKELWPGASEERRSGTVTAFNAAYKTWEITTCLRKAHFFAQSMEEVGPSIRLSESLDYKASVLKTGYPFSYFGNHPAEAELYGRVEGKGGHAANQQEIANRAYATTNGNTGYDSGDGWRYRGGGYIQLTGRGNYQAVQDEIAKKDSSIDIINNEGDIRTYKGAMVSAMAYWNLNHCSVKADMGDTGAHVDAVTAVVNLKTKTYADRRDNFDISKKTFKVAECVDRARSMMTIPLGDERAQQQQQENIPIPRPRPANR